MNSFDNVGGFKPFKLERNPVNEIELPYNKIKAYDMDTELQVNLLQEGERATSVNDIAFFILSNDRDNFVNVTNYQVSNGEVRFKMPKIDEGKYYPQIMDREGSVYSSTDNEYIDVVYNRESRTNELFPIIKEQIIEEMTPRLKQYLMDNKEQFSVKGDTVVGPIGPEGPRGPRGHQGNRGPMGYTGETGPQGEVGDRGPRGFRGNRGFRGLDGSPGPQGVVGPQGIEGPIGDTGPIGPQGIQGVVGPQGDIGPQGEVGPVGPQGVQGIEGPQGPQGVDGPQGVIGDKGDRGESGVTTPINSMFTLSEVDGDLYAYFNDENNPPQFEIDEDDNIYYIINE